MYAVAIPATVQTVFPTINDVHGKPLVHGQGVYFSCLVAMIIIITPFVFFNFQKTKLLQVLTQITRHTVFWIMIGAACAFIASSSSSSESDAMEGVTHLIAAVNETISATASATEQCPGSHGVGATLFR